MIFMLASVFSIQEKSLRYDGRLARFLEAAGRLEELPRETPRRFFFFLA